MTVDEYRDFLLAVVNAHDRSAREGLRKRFVRLYRGWFPDDMKGEGAEEAVHVLLFAYRPFQMWFFKDAPIFENPQTEFALHVAILRDKLKSIWIARAVADTAKYRLEELKHDTREYRCGKKGGHEAWRKRTLNALEWLGEDLSRLLTCANPKCELETRLFFRQHNNDRYCSTECSSSAQQEKRMERRAAKSKPFTRSDEARMNMSEGAKRRWRDDGDKKSAPNGKSIKKRVRRTAHEVRNTPLPPSASEETPPPSMLPTPTVGQTEQKIDSSSHMQTSTRQEPRCSFCGKSQTEAAFMMSTPPEFSPAFICDECVAVCNSLIEENRAKPASAKAPAKAAKKGTAKKVKQSNGARSDEVLAHTASRVSIAARGNQTYGGPLRITLTLKQPSIGVLRIELLSESGTSFGSLSCVPGTPNTFATVLEQDVARQWFDGGVREGSYSVRRLVLRATLLIEECQAQKELVVYLTSVPMREPGGRGLAYGLNLSGDC